METLKYGKWLLIGLAIVMFMACGGGDSNPAETEMNVYVKQNQSALESTPIAHALYKALDEEYQLIADVLGEGWEYTEWTEGHIESILSSEEVSQLAHQLATIHNEKVLPSAEAIKISLSEIIDSEQEIENLTRMLKTSRGLEQASLTAMGWVAIAILSAALAVQVHTYETADNVVTTQNPLVAAQEGNATALKDGLNLLGHVYEFSEVAVPAATISLVADAATGGLSTLSKVSKVHHIKIIAESTNAVNTINTLTSTAIGINKCIEEESADSNARAILAAVNDELEQEIVYMGKSDEEGTLHNILEGDWTFVIFNEGNIRTVTDCIDISGDQDTIEYQVDFTPIEEIEDSSSDENDGDSATTSLAYYKPTQAACESAGGDWHNDIDECQVDWNEGMSICEMPSIEMWRDVIAGCGGILNEITINEENDTYEQCIKDSVGHAGAYWSSSTDTANTADAWIANLRNGHDFTYYKTYRHAYLVRCVH